MSLELTENKSNIGSCALNYLVFILYCRVIGQWLPTRRKFLEIGRQPIGDWSAISRWLKSVSGLFATAATGRRSVANQSATCRRPPKNVLRSIWSQRCFTCSSESTAENAWVVLEAKLVIFYPRHAAVTARRWCSIRFVKQNKDPVATKIPTQRQCHTL